MNVIWRRIGCGVVLVWVFLMAGCATGQNGGNDGELPTASEQTDAQKRAAIRMQLAIGYYQQRQLPVALDETKRALDAYPDYADAYGMRALIYMGMGEDRLAEENFARALSLSPKNPEISNNYGWFLCQSGQVAKAMPYFEAAFNNRSYQTPSKALNNAGICSLKAKDSNAAARYLLKAFQYDPSNPVTNVNLARVYYDRKDYERAHFYIGRVIQAEVLTADALWLGIKIAHKRGDRETEAAYVTQLQRHHSDSPEYAAYQRGAFDE